MIPQTGLWVDWEVSLQVFDWSHSTTWTCQKLEDLLESGRLEQPMTSIISQVYESLESGDTLTMPTLKQQKSLLSGKLDILSRLDDELIEMVA